MYNVSDLCTTRDAQYSKISSSAVCPLCELNPPPAAIAHDTAVVSLCGMSDGASIDHVTHSILASHSVLEQFYETLYHSS